MSTILQTIRPLRALRYVPRARWNSNDAPQLDPSLLIAAPGAQIQHPKGSRARLNIEVDPNHGLWAFFRKTQKKGEKVGYETVESRDSIAEDSGRSWKAIELRRKSFKDLHTLWYVLVRERNLLATQREEARRIGVRNPEALAATTKAHQCRKSMARIKCVINERRLLYEKHLRATPPEAKESSNPSTTPANK
ncbi:mitochondrial 39-S ribosomal protein L47 (MRP-L47)-domain-containing protein [Hygrophoropsis aurantiaca]|uniref:Mitochondrial 39-S ribosomal protein L47 (MRP-L47)-domain-containing protein n=1 Tax=Hygrophoropsis aurantiaca TaxID=72124 RepID=A0ACB8AJH5_9AGAM|nr:mitochondrial 39-S ribosomal protein L47 (MRP-L47)-domain-containing protein [Hygrophoropsis aurantiaca]